MEFFIVFFTGLLILLWSAAWLLDAAIDDITSFLFVDTPNRIKKKMRGEDDV